eukprot:Skav233154  [mRNA]  locus=scaffold1669:223023:224309:+ [translate_table: standard]
MSADKNPGVAKCPRPDTGEQVAFFQKLHDEKKRLDGRLSWEVVKASLVTTLTKRKVTTSSTDIQTKFLPLSVWVQQGWEETVVKNCPSEYSSEYKCETYKVPVKSQNWQEAHTEVKERVLTQERAASAKRGVKAKENEAPLDLPTGKTPKDSSEKDAQKAARNEAVQAKKNAQFNQKQHLLASKQMGMLAQDLTALKKLQARVPQESLDEGVRDTCQKTLTQLESWNGEALKAVQQWESEKVKTGEERLSDLSFQPADVKSLHLSVVEISKSLRTFLPAPKPKAAKAKAKRSSTSGVEGSTEATESEKKRRRGKTAP